ncbi:class I SAM-dependent methyltransferase [Oligoflexia bacterium]|nr:class I SAM-dependent methyltransferase [Oligoflexia bacterium]
MYSDTAKNYDKIFKFNPAVIDLIQSQLNAQPCKILDIGCGTGKYCSNLAKDHSVVGLDPDPQSISVAKSLFTGPSFYNHDLFSFEAEKDFDLIFCIGNVISHIEQSRLPHFIDQVRSLLKNHGIWIFHTINWDFILKQSEFTFPVLSNEGVTFKRYYKSISEDSVAFETVLIDESGTETKNSITLYPHTDNSLQACHNLFSQVAHFADYRQTAFQPESISSVYVFKAC